MGLGELVIGKIDVFIARLGQFLAEFLTFIAVGYRDADKNVGLCPVREPVVELCYVALSNEVMGPYFASASIS